MAFDIAFRALTDEFVDRLPAFKCGRESLDAFLLDDAPSYHKHGLTHTTLVFVEGDPAIAGFFCLSSDSVNLTTYEAGELALPFEAPLKFFPAVKITRFGILLKHQRAGLGLQLIEAIEGLVYADGSSPVATRLLTVDAVNEDDVIAFYSKAKFLPCLEAEKKSQKQKRDTILMYKDIYAEA